MGAPVSDPASGLVDDWTAQASKGGHDWVT